MFPTGFGLKLIAVLTAYIDESGTHTQSPIMGLGGFVSDTGRWESFERRWQNFLDWAGIPFFHMTDFENRKQIYEGWSDEKRLTAIKRICKIIRQSALFGFQSAIVKRDYEALSDSDRRLIGDEYTLCANQCGQFVAEWQRKTGRDEPVAYVFEAGAPGANILHRVFTNTLNNEKLRKKFQLLSIRFERKHDFKPLQAADIMAYEAPKQTARRIGLVERPMRRIEEELIKKIEFKGQFFDAWGLEKFLAERRQGD